MEVCKHDILSFLLSQLSLKYTSEYKYVIPKGIDSEAHTLKIVPIEAVKETGGVSYISHEKEK